MVGRSLPANTRLTQTQLPLVSVCVFVGLGERVCVCVCVFETFQLSMTLFYQYLSHKYYYTIR